MRKIRVLFVCHGNICRSPMAESVFCDMVEKRKLAEQFFIGSAATSREEIGNPVHPGTARKLRELGIPLREHYAVQMCRADVERYDYLLGMDSRNLANMRRIAGQDADQICRLLDFSDHPRDIADPWYTGDFGSTYADIREGCETLLRHILAKDSGE